MNIRVRLVVFALIAASLLSVFVLKDASAEELSQEQLDRITARIVSRLDDGRGLWLFALDNGTTWQMTETTPFDPPRGGDSVVIRRGTLGGYAMLLGAGSMVRMRRLN